MNDYFIYIFLGIVQGITEWLPVSSSGHLVIFQHFLGITENVTFNILVHFTSLFVIFIVFKNRIFEVIKTPKFWPYIIIGSIPAGLFGFFVLPYLQSIYNNMFVVGFSLLITSLLLYFSNYNFKKKKINYKNSFFIGFFQAIAIFPGISRSGSTIVGGNFLGIPKKEAIEFSFLLAIPAIFGAALLDLKNFNTITTPMIIGSIVNIFTGYFCIKLLIRWVMNGKLKYFSYYCLGLGILLLTYYFFNLI